MESDDTIKQVDRYAAFRSSFIYTNITSFCMHYPVVDNITIYSLLDMRFRVFAYTKWVFHYLGLGWDITIECSVEPISIVSM